MLPRRDSKPLEFPALLPMFGGMEKKLRFLDREVITLGRARGSDICLDGSEVSALHTIIYRSADGYHVRDCGSRTGTRVNGHGVKNVLIGNGDVLQIGPFSFEVRIPKGFDVTTAPDPVRVERLKRSRSRLADLALRLRKKLLTKKPPANGHAVANAVAHAANSVDLTESKSIDKRAAELKSKIRHYDQKVNQLEESEKELADEQEALKSQRREFEEQCLTREAELAERNRQLDVEIERRCGAVHTELQELKSATANAVANPERLQELQDLQTKHQELEAMEKKLKARDKEINDDYKEITKERERVEKLKEQWEQEQHEARRQFEKQKETAEETLQTQRSQLGDMIEQLKKMQDDLRTSSQGESAQLKRQIEHLKKELEAARAQKQVSDDDGTEIAQLREKLAAALAEVEALSLTLQQTNGLNREVETLQNEMQLAEATLRQQVELLQAENEGLRQQAGGSGGFVEARLVQLQSENEALKKLADELQQHFAASDRGASPSPLAVDAEDIRQENQVLRRLLDEAEADLRQFKDGGAQNQVDPTEFATLQNELQSIREHLREKDRVIADLKESANDIPVRDPESYEAELNRFRKELEADRARLNKEIESLRQRNHELDDATRELEMELSRERAEMARERIRLDRMRDEVKADMERLQREHEVRGSLGGVQKLREEIAQKTGGPPRSASDRLRTMSKLP
jgi:pSer/pThr/pTyr-binding forkhead associated (FHA) protein